ncbi:hypothetical protein AG1IA_08299 [Rhizoctonia solani AG-1 IA]|uniref:Uncharacterized protein n=1 Tax=Thanatephorus cucumeris (strain AG1-IA) TaxID=983506 RepID=L8WMU6_THACA|nr:hypothetical protein AG1IA_08299 [Rhizoctonia solani AG-1 IA]
MMAGVPGKTKEEGEEGWARTGTIPRDSTTTVRTEKEREVYSFSIIVDLVLYICLWIKIVYMTRGRVVVRLQPFSVNYSRYLGLRSTINAMRYDTDRAQSAYTKRSRDDMSQYCSGNVISQPLVQAEEQATRAAKIE